MPMASLDLFEAMSSPTYASTRLSSKRKVSMFSEVGRVDLGAFEVQI